MIFLPRKFVGLHAHTGASAMDGLGSPQDHIAFCKENGLDAFAATEHGQMNSMANAYLYVEKLNKSGDKFKFLPGAELYIHPDLNSWKSDYELDRETKINEKEAKKLAKKEKEKNKTIIDVVQDEDDEVIDMSNSLTIENEEESKGSSKFFNPVNRRHHLVVLPKTYRGLQKLYHLVSRGYTEGFYRFPRIDFKMLKQAAQECDNELIVSSACLAGLFSWHTMRNCQEYEFNTLNASILDDKSLLDKCVKDISNVHDQLVDAVGIENAYLEIQFNKLGAQHLVNRALIEYARRNNLQKQLIVTCDSHYPRPELWKEREIYKKLGWMNYKEFSPDDLPRSKDELKCELYPKNAQQVWDEYQLSKNGNPWYDDKEVCEAIERTHDIAHHVIGDIKLDKSYKYPTKIIPSDTTAMKMLIKLSLDGLKKKKLDKDKIYVDRLKHELEIIKKMDNAAYFVTLEKMLRLVREQCLLGVARGSSGGSLVCYLLEITDLDPIKYNCRFDRFLNVHRQGAPDIDVDIADRDKALTVLRNEFGFNNVVPISNVNVFKTKSLLKDLSKFHSVPFDEANAATRSVEQEVRKALHKHGDDKNLFILTYDDAMKHSPSFKEFIDKYPQVGENMKTLFKEQRSLGRHAGGVVILDDAPRQIPLIASKGEPQTPWTEGVAMKLLEPLGFIKYDLLGLETMRLIERAIELIIQQTLGKLLKLEFDEETIEIYENQEIELINGEFIKAKDLNDTHDVMIPLNVRKS